MVSVAEFSKKIKEKYPAYKDVDDYELAEKIVKKYPVYADKVDLKKKEKVAPAPKEEIPTVSLAPGEELPSQQAPQPVIAAASSPSESPLPSEKPIPTEPAKPVDPIDEDIPGVNPVVIEDVRSWFKPGGAGDFYYGKAADRKAKFDEYVQLAATRPEAYNQIKSQKNALAKLFTAQKDFYYENPAQATQDYNDYYQVAPGQGYDFEKQMDVIRSGKRDGVQLTEGQVQEVKDNLEFRLNQLATRNHNRLTDMLPLDTDDETSRSSKRKYSGVNEALIDFKRQTEKYIPDANKRDEVYADFFTTMTPYLASGLRGSYGEDGLAIARGKTPEYADLNDYQVMYMESLKYANPDQYQTKLRLMSTPAELAKQQEGVDFKTGWEELQKEAEDYGLNMEQDRLTRLIDGLNQKKEKTPQDQALMQNYVRQLEDVEKTRASQSTRYYYAWSNEILDKIGKSTGIGTYSRGDRFITKTGKVVSNAVNFVTDIASGIWGTSEDSRISDITDLGNQRNYEMLINRPHSEVVQGPVKYVIDAEFEKQINGIVSAKGWSNESVVDMQTAWRDFRNKTGKPPVALVSTEPGGINLSANAVLNAVEDVGSQLLGITILGGATGGMANVSKARQLANLFGTTFATTVKDYETQAIREGKKNPTETAIVGALVDAATELIGNDLARVKKLFGGKGTAGRILNDMTEDQWKRMVAASTKRGVFSKFKDAGAQVFSKVIAPAGTESIEEVSAEVLKKMFDGEGLKGKQFIHDIKNTGVTTFIGTVATFGAGLPFSYKNVHYTTQASMYETGTNPKWYIENINKQLAAGQITQKQAQQRIDIVNKMQGIVDKLPTVTADGKPMSDKDRVKMAFNQYVKEEATKQKGVVGENAKLKEVIEELDAENNRIINNEEPAEEVAPEAPTPVEDAQKLDATVPGVAQSPEQAAGAVPPSEVVPEEGVGEVAPAVLQPNVEQQKELIAKAIKEAGYDATTEQLDEIYNGVIDGNGKIEPGKVRRILKAGYIGANTAAEYINELDIKALPPVKAAAVDRSNKTFPESEINKANPNEVDILKEVQNSDVIKQAKIDQDLHNSVQDTDRFSEEDKKFLEEDKKLKQRFIDLIEGKNVSVQEINDVVEGLQKDKSIHVEYLKMPENENTGSHIWHNHWISVYDGWISKLNEIKSSISGEVAGKQPEGGFKPVGVAEDVDFGETPTTKTAVEKEEKNLRQRALNLEPTDIRGVVLQYFLSGGKINPAAIKELFGGRGGAEKIRWKKKGGIGEQRAMLGMQSKDAPSLDELAHNLWENSRAKGEELGDTQDFKNEIEDVLQSHTGTKSMAEEMVQSYDADYMERLNQQEQAAIAEEAHKEFQKIASLLPSNIKEDILKLLDKYRDSNGFVDWNALEEGTNGFDPDFIELSPESSKYLNDAIEQVKQTGRFSGIPSETVTPEAKAEPAAEPAKAKKEKRVKGTTIYHYTNEDISDFDESRGGVWFTTNSFGYPRKRGLKNKVERTINEKELNLATDKQVFQAGDGDYQKGLQELKKQGFDGVKRVVDGDKEFYIFDKSKLGEPKSETKKGKYKAEAEKIAEKIMSVELPSWLKADLPPGTQKMGIDEDAIKKALANAVIKVGELMDRGVEFSQAVKEATKDLVDLFGKDKEKDIQDNFSNYYKQQQDAVQERGAEEVLQREQEGAGEAGGERKRMEQGKQRIEAAEKENEVTGEEEKLVPFSLAGVEQVSEEFGLPTPVSTTKTDEQLKAEAEKTIEDWQNTGEYASNIEELLNRLEETDPAKRGLLTDVQRMVLENHLNNLKKELNGLDITSKAYDKGLKTLQRLLNLASIARSDAGRALRLPSTAVVNHPVNDLHEAMVAKMEATGQEQLTDAQKQEVVDQVAEYKEKLAESEAKMKVMEEKLAQLEIEKMKGFEQTEQKATGKPKKSKEQRQADRKKSIEAARQALKDLRTGKSGLSAVPLPGIRELIAIAPHVKNVVASYVGEGIDNLPALIDRAYDEFKDVLPGLSKRNIRQIIAGEIGAKKQTESEARRIARQIQQEAKLLEEYERLQNQEPPKPKPGAKQLTPAQEQAERDRQRRMSALRKNINELRKESGELDQQRMDAIRSRNEKMAAEINDRIARKDFAKPETTTTVIGNPELKKRFPREYKAMLDAIKVREDAKHEFDIALLKDELAQQSKWKKVVRKGRQIVATMKALRSGIDDSAVLVQNYLAILAYPKAGIKAFITHIGHAFSQKRYDRWHTELQNNTAVWQLIQESGLDVTEPQSLSQEKREEAFSDNLLDKTFRGPGGKYYNIGKYTTRPFERAFTSMGNAIRVEVFLRVAEKWHSQGKTFDSNPQDYKALAQMLNTETGRGKLHKNLQAASNLITPIIWSPRLMQSKFNVLGLSDLAGGLGFGKGYYAQMTPEVRKMALKDAASFIGTGAGLMMLTVLSGAGDADIDPESVNFGTISIGNKRISVFDGFNKYVRTTAKLITGRQKVPIGYAEGEGFDKESIEANRLKTLGTFFRGSVTPAAGLGLNALLGEDYMGRPLTFWKEAESMVVPMSASGMIEEVKRDGGLGVPIGFAKFFGAQISDQRDFEARAKMKIDDPETGMKRPVSRKEYQKFADAKEKAAGELLEDFKSDVYPIFITKNGKGEDVLVLSQGDLPDDVPTVQAAEAMKEVPYGKLTTKLVEDLMKKIDKLAKNQALAELKISILED